MYISICKFLESRIFPESFHIYRLNTINDFQLSTCPGRVRPNASRDVLAGDHKGMLQQPLRPLFDDLSLLFTAHPGQNATWRWRKYGGFKVGFENWVCYGFIVV